MLAKIKTLAGITALTAATCGVASQANAQEGIHPYLGASYGFYKSGDGDYDEDRDLWEVYGGLALHRFFAVEANYANLGKMSNAFSEVNSDGWGLAVVGQLPIGDMFSVYGKLGNFWYNTEVDLSLNDNVDNFDADGNEPFYTVGVGFGMAEPITVTLEYTRHNADVDLEEFENFDELGENSDGGDLDTAKIGVRLAF